MKSLAVNVKSNSYLTLLGCEIVILLLTLISLFFKAPGWIFGCLIGVIFAFLVLYLLEKGAALILNSRKFGFVVLFYLARMVCFIVPLLLCAYLDYVLHVDFCKFSLFGCAIAFVPIPLVTTITNLNKD